MNPLADNPQNKIPQNNNPSNSNPSNGNPSNSNPLNNNPLNSNPSNSNPFIKSPLINTALFKEQLKRFWFIGALTLLAYLLCVVLPLHRSVNQPYELRNQIEGLITLLSMKNPAVLFIGVVAPLAAALTLFAYLFQPRATTVLHALPFNKKQLFFTNVAAGLTIILVPLCIFCAALLIPIHFPSPDFQLNHVSLSTYGGWETIRAPVALFPQGLAYDDVINTPLVIVGFFARMLMIQLFFMALFTLAACLAGNPVIAFLCAGALPLIPLGLYLLAMVTSTYYMFGFSSYAMESFMAQALPYLYPLCFAMRYGSPYFILGETVAGTVSSTVTGTVSGTITGAVTGALYDASTGTGVETVVNVMSVWPLFVVHILLSAAMLALACLCFHKRRQERAGDSIVFNPFKKLLVFMLSLLGMLLLGVLMMQTLKSIPALYVGYGLGFTLTYFVAQMIAEKCVNVWHKAKYLFAYGSVALVLLLAAEGMTRFDWLGYAHYVPAESEVVGVYLGGTYDYYQRRSENDPFFFIEDRTLIGNTLALHRDIVYDRHELRKTHLGTMSGQIASWYDTVSMDFLYLLKDGSVVSRQYTLPYDFALRPGGVNVYDLLAADAVILAPYHAFKALSAIESVVVEFYDFANSQQHEINVYLPGAFPSLAEALQKDIVLTEQEQVNERRQFAEQYVYLGHAPLAGSETEKRDAAVSEADKHDAAVEPETTEQAAQTVYGNWYGYLNGKGNPYLNRAVLYFSLGRGEHTRAWIEANGYYSFDD